jgi:Insect cuticle protein
MAFKFVMLVATLAAVNAGIIEPGWQQPAAWQQPALIKKVIAHEEPANYEFNYEVNDQHTGDIKNQWEKAQNGAVSGEYSLIDADGYRRIVSYHYRYLKS